MVKETIAYGSMSADYGAPGDRRRFAGFAKRENLQLVHLHPESPASEIAVLTLGADLSRWKKIKQRHGKVIIDIVDSYFDESVLSLRRQLRGTYKSLTREISIPHLRYTALMERVIANADGIVCASLEQKQTLDRLNANVHVIGDCFEELIDESFKEAQRAESRRILWEGMPDNLKHLKLVNLNGSGLELVTVTAASYRQTWHWRESRPTSEYLRRLKIPADVVPWSIRNLKEVAQSCNSAVIPIVHTDPMAWRKSENKLLGLWALGVPVFVSPTPSYSRILKEASLTECLVNQAEWKEKLMTVSSDRESLNRIGLKGYEFATSRVSPSFIDPQWNRLLRSVKLT